MSADRAHLLHARDLAIILRCAGTGDPHLAELRRQVLAHLGLDATW